MTILFERDLGTDGIAYVRQCLRQAQGLSSKLLELPLTSGKAYAPIPEQTSVNRAKSFNEGGLITRHETNVWLVEHLWNLWKIEGGGTLVLQDIWAKPSDPAAQRTQSKKFFNDANVYYFLEEDDTNVSAMESTIRSIASYLLVAVFTGYVIRDSDLLPDRLVGHEIIDALARATKEVFVSAYDQEGLVIWRR